MNIPAPHFQLFSHASSARRVAYAGGDDSGGEWRFVLKREDGRLEVEAADEEPGTPADRLELLAIVRGLEALDQPSRVTLFTQSRYVSRGLRFGLENWRENDWQWERFGQMTPVKNSDLWRRIDQALKFHQVDVRTPLYDEADDLSVAEPFAADSEEAPDFREVREPASTIPPRRMRLRGRDLRVDAGPDSSVEPLRYRRGQPPPGFFAAAISAARQFFGG